MKTPTHVEMNQLAEALLYLSICLRPCCTACLTTTSDYGTPLERIVLNPDVPSAWVWACAKHAPIYRALAAPRGRLPVVR